METEPPEQPESLPDLDPTLIPRLNRYHRSLFGKMFLGAGLGIASGFLFARNLLPTLPAGEEKPLPNAIMNFPLDNNLAMPFAIVCLLGMVLACVGILTNSYQLRGIEKSIERLGKTEDIQRIGTLLSILGATNGALSLDPIYEALTRLLPQLRPEHSHLVAQKIGRAHV